MHPILLTLALAQFQAFGLRDGDRVLFYGDSITDQCLYTNYVEAFALLRYPTLKVTFVNSGWGGDSVRGGAGGNAETRVARDVRPYGATVVTVMLGMNDGRYAPFDKATYDAFSTDYAKLLDRLIAATRKARFTLIQTSPFDETTRPPRWPGGYNDGTLLKMGEVVRREAQSRRFAFVDFNQPLVELMAKAKDANLKAAQNIIPDSVHPGPAGHLAMAAALLESWSASPFVSEVRLDAATRSVEARGAEVAGFDGASWTQTDACFPYPIDHGDATMALVDQCGNLSEKLNQETLSVTGLEEGGYLLRIDKQRVGVFSAAELAQGLDLARLDTPMRRRARQVLDLTNQRVRIRKSAWRDYSIPYAELRSVGSVLKSLGQLESEVVARRAELLKQRTYRYELVRVPATD